MLLALWRRTRWIAVGVATLAMSAAASGQTATERAMTGIRTAVTRQSMITTCNSLADALAVTSGIATIIGGASSVAAGRAAEDLVSQALGLAKNTDAYEGGTRIPDFRAQGHWYEVKNVQRQGWTRQLRDTWKAANKSGNTYTIITRYDTVISKRLLREVAKKGGKLRIIKCLPHFV